MSNRLVLFDTYLKMGAKMKKIIFLFIFLNIMVTNTSCGNSTIITDDNIVRVQKQSESVLLEEIQKSEGFDIETWKNKLPKRVKTEISDEHLSININANVIIPEITIRPDRYRAEIVDLSSEEKIKLVDCLWGDVAENVKNNGSYSDYGFYQDMLGARLLFDKTILYNNANDKPFDLLHRSFTTNHTVNIGLTMEEAKALCVELLENIGYKDMQLVSPGIVSLFDWNNNAEQGYYYLGFSQVINNIPIKGWVDNQNVWDAYMGPGNRTAVMFFSVDNKGIFKIQGNLYSVYLQEKYTGLLSMEEVIKQLKMQLPNIVISGIEGKYGTTIGGIMTEIPICEIELVYLLNANEKGEFYFDPYWRFVIGESNVDGAVLTNICVNAVTGEVGLYNE